MTAYLAPLPVQQFFDNNGNPLAGGSLYTYAAGTSTPQVTYTDSTGGTPNANPILLDAYGRCAYYLAPALSYKLVLKDAAGNTIWTADQLAGSAPASLIAGLSSIDQPATNLIFPQNGAKIQRLNDRLMVGGATVSDLLFPNVIQDWLTTLQIAAGLPNGSILNAQSASLTNTNASAAFGVLSGSQSLNFTNAGAACIGSTAFAVNNNTTLATKAWAFYGEAWKLTAVSGQAIGMELDVYSTVATITPHPGQQGDGVGIQLAVGADLTGALDASVGIQFAANPAKWKKGINFMHNSLTGSSGGVGESCAIAMAMTQNLEWYTSAGVRNGFIKFNTATSTNRTGIISNDFGFFIVGNTEQPLMLCANIALATNYPQLVASVAGNPVQVFATGAAATIDLQLRTTGSGIVLSDSPIACMNHTAIPAGGTAGKGFLLSSTANFGIFFGSGVPTLSAAKGSLYLRTDGSSTSTRSYVNTDGGTTWTNNVSGA